MRPTHWFYNQLTTTSFTVLSRISIQILIRRKRLVFPRKEFGHMMKTRTTTFYLSIAGLLIAAANLAAYAYNAKVETPKSSEPQNELIFNWGSGS